jgi:nucleoside 2-deoxyribosyltransferase
MTTTPKQTSKVYLAGPMFSDGDKAEQAALAEALNAADFEVHMPQSDGIEVGNVMNLLNDPKLHDVKNGDQMLEPFVLDRCTCWVTRTVVALDLYESVEGCQCTVLNIDGRVPDEGSLVEATLAWNAGHPVILYKTTPIAELGRNNNPMIGVISGWGPICSTPAEVAEEVARTVKAGRVVAPAAAAPPSDVQRLMDLGRVVADIRARGLNTAAQLTKAADDLAQDSELMKLLEPEKSLQPMCRELVVAVIKLSKVDTGDPTNRRTTRRQQEKIVSVGITALKGWLTRPGVRKAILDNPISC